MKKYGWLIFVGIALLLFVIIYLLTPAQEKYDWSASYERTSNQPYGFQLLYNLLKTEYAGSRFVEINKPLRENLEVLKNQHDALYFIAGGWLYLDSSAQNAVMDFVSDGNTAFISAAYVPYNIYYDLLNGKISDSTDEEYSNYYQPYQFSDSIVSFSLLHVAFQNDSCFKVNYIFNWKFVNGEWNYFFEKGREESLDSVAALGAINTDYVNFIRVKYGNGYFYLHSNPIAFTNFNLNHEQGFKYLQNVFSNFHPATIIWDEASKLPYQDDRSKQYAGESPLKFILGNRSLRWAWYVLLFAMLLFILFRAKRVQKTIPVIEPNLNTSLEFVQTVSRLYFLQNDHLALAKQKMKLFSLFIRNKYKITLKNNSEEELNRLAVKSEINFKEVKHIFTSYKLISSRTHITADELIEFHKSIDHFYHTCK